MRLRAIFGRIRGAFSMGLAWAAWVIVSSAATPDFQSGRPAHAERSIRIGFWLDNGNSELMTPATVDFIGRRASLVVYDGTVKPVDPYFGIEQVVARFKRQHSDLPVLLYQWSQLAHDSWKAGSLPFKEITSHADWIVRTKSGKPVAVKGGHRYWIDIAQPGYQAFLPQYAKQLAEQYGVDGIAYDNTKFVRPTFGINKREIEYDRLVAGYPAATKKLLADVKSALGPQRILLFNGLWPTADGELEQQLQLLKFAHAAQVEYFGYYPDPVQGEAKLRDEFDRYMAGIIRAVQANPDKIILVCGRSRRYVYLDYEEDYRAQRYCLAGYLMAMTPLSLYKFNSHYQTLLPEQGRTDAMAYYADYDLDLGRPLEAARQQEGIWRRRFERALVAMGPNGYGDHPLRLDRAYFTPEGRPCEGSITVHQGEGVILLRERTAEPPRRIVINDFADGEPGEWRFPLRDDATCVISGQGERFLRLRTSPNAPQWYHERRVQPIRSLAFYPRLRFRIRSEDPAAAALLRVEVNDLSPAPTIVLQDKDGVLRKPPFDEDKRRAFAVLVLKPQGGTYQFRNTGSDIPYGNLKPSGHKVPWLSCPASEWASDGQWHEIVVDLPAVLNEVAPHLRPTRVPVMRVLGDADLDDVIIEKP